MLRTPLEALPAPCSVPSSFYRDLEVRGSAFAAALLNLVAAATALFLDRTRNADQAMPEPVEQQDIPMQARLALTLYALAGGIALGYEVVWSQSIAQFLSTRAFAFSVVLATYLAGLVVGSALYARFAKSVRDSWGVFGFLIAAAGLVALLEIAGLSLWQLKVQAGVGELIFRLTSSESARIYARFAGGCDGNRFLPHSAAWSCISSGAAALPLERTG